MTRTCGILLHPTSLPGRFGIGDLGESAYRFADWLAQGGQSIWQVLPLGPPGFGNSPYQALSSMAGNPLLISLDRLADQGLIPHQDLRQVPEFNSGQVEFDKVIAYKLPLLRKAAEIFLTRASAEFQQDFEQFCHEKRSWLDSFARFSALLDVNGRNTWTEWQTHTDPDLKEVRIHQFIQFEFWREWSALRRYCNERGIAILGDIPIFVAHNSADVWGNPHLFDLDPGGNPRTIAGVPPDYFSATGQCWGNPLYRWDAMAEHGYEWWIQRVRATLEQVDMVRLDHFRGFEKYYEIPGGSRTAVNGRWVDGPGDRFFARVREVFGRLPFIAEDLGMITPEVHALRDRLDLPGMRVLQFAFGNPSPDDPFKPYNFIRNCVVYTGTHDNDTTLGWFHATPGENSTLDAVQMRKERELALHYVQSNGQEIHWDFIRVAVSSVADTAIYPMQDVLGLGSDARMNRPATAENNWTWRFREGDLRGEHSDRLQLFARTYGRMRQERREVG
jgi:4-alpha-glucanotransferase